MPSLWEAYPLLPMEAMCMGVPVLGTDCIGLREVLGETPSMVVPALDSEALAQALLKATVDPWTEAAAAYTPTAHQRFDVATRAGQLVSFLDTLGASSSRSSLN